KTLRIWKIADGQLLHTLLGHTGPLCSVAFHPDGKHLATGSYDSTVKLWDLSRPSETIIRRDLPGFVGSMTFDAEDTRLLAGTTGGAVLLDAASGRTIRDLSDKRVSTGFAQFDVDGTHVVVGRE